MNGPGQDTPPNQYQSLPASASLSSLSRAELFLLGGGALILLTDLVFARLGPYGFADVIWAAAAGAVVLILLRTRLTGLVPYDRTLIVMAGLATLLLAREVVRDVIFLSGRVTIDPLFVLGMAGLYAGVALMAYGALLLWRSRAR